MNYDELVKRLHSVAQRNSVIENTSLYTEAANAITNLKSELHEWQRGLGSVLSTIPVGNVLRASGSFGDSIKYFKNLHKQRDDLQSELEQCRKDAEWQPIDTAPKDGTSILIYTGEGIVEASYQYGNWEQAPCYATYEGCGGVALSCKPTHWKPLPQPPVTDAAIDKAMESWE